MAKFQRHVFVCINERPAGNPKGCCASKGGVEVASELKRRLYERGLKRIVRPNKSYCLDQCARGVAMVVYPEGVWYGRVTVDDLDEIIDEHIIGGRVVNRLALPARGLTGLQSDAIAPFDPTSATEASQ